MDVIEVPSTEESIERLKEFSPIDVPEDYLSIIRKGTDVEIFVKLENEDFDMYIRFWGADFVVSENEALNLEFLSDSLIIGDNEGGQVIVYTTGPEGFGVYLTGYGVLDKNESTFIALSLEDFLTKNVGIERLAE
ncbi:SMI1/KNR4 family protein [Priestia filamentosa]|uniref:SMI1/KNR4 family protein n=1 Tax=Priestia filamentosa TaxID=1402861 RepID=UPI001C7CDD07|nr:SMI1/KNR4 family protein [Priestia filamentosa]